MSIPRGFRRVLTASVRPIAVLQIAIAICVFSGGHVNAEDATPLRVAVIDFANASAKGPNHLRAVLTEEAGFETDVLAPNDVIEGQLSTGHYNVIIMPGGSGSGHARELGDVGAANVRQFVGDGGGYIGICAGAYLGCSHYSWSLDLMNATSLDTKHWRRGQGQVTLAFSEAGQQGLGHPADEGETRFGQGPLLAPGDHPDLPAYEELATYATEIAENGAVPGVMIGTTAIARSTFEDGRVILVSPHPETPGDLNHLIVNAVKWVGEPSRAPSNAEFGDSNDQLEKVLERPEIRVVVTDSGLGGMSIAADIYERLQKHRGFRRAEVIFFNCQPHETSGYNSLANTAEKAWVFDNALAAMEANFDPDVILIGCNTLSVIYDETEFSRTTEIPVIGIVDPGVRLIEKHLADDDLSQVAILGTPTTIGRGQHRAGLLRDGIAGERIIVQQCSRLAGRIERAPSGAETRELVDKYTAEVVAQLNGSTAPLFVSYNCTHYGYVNDLFEDAFAKRGIDVAGFLNPNSLLGDPLFPELKKARFNKCSTTISVYSQPALSEAKLTAIYDLIAPASPASAEATREYRHTPTSFEWQR